MEENNLPSRSLDFNGKLIGVAHVEGKNWVAVKPICEALNVNYERQRQNIHNSPILGELPAIQQVVAADGVPREMLCLEEKYIYGWLFSLNSSSPELIAFQKECYDVLFNHFHGVLADRVAILDRRNAEAKELEALMKELKKDERYLRVLELEKSKRAIPNQLKALDHKIAPQGELFTDENQ